MHKKLLLGIIFSIVLVSIPVGGQGIGDILSLRRIEITNFYPPDVATAGETFTVNVTIRNNRLLPLKVTVRVDLLDGLLNCIKKNIGEKTMCIWHGETHEPIKIDCVIREGDIDWYKEKYNVQAMLFLNFPLGFRSPREECSTVRGIQLKSKLCEKDKVRIYEMEVIEILEEGEDKFDVVVRVINEGWFDASARIHVDMIEKPSAIPEFEKFVNLEGLASERKELGRSAQKIVKSQYGKEDFVVPCYLRSIESKKERFTIEAVLFVNIEGREYQVDSSTLYEIYHEQPIWRDWSWWFIIGAVIGGIMAIALIIVVIRRIRHPMYGFRKIRKKI